MSQENNKQYFESMWEYVKDSSNDFEDANTFGEAEEGTMKIIEKIIIDDTDFSVIETYIEKDGVDYAQVSWNENDGNKYFIPMKNLNDKFFLVIAAYKVEGYTKWRTLSGILRETEEDAQKEIDDEN